MCKKIIRNIIGIIMSVSIVCGGTLGVYAQNIETGTEISAPQEEDSEVEETTEVEETKPVAKNQIVVEDGKAYYVDEKGIRVTDKTMQKAKTEDKPISFEAFKVSFCNQDRRLL